jgi:methyl-accepting chemotaxis protein
VIALVVLLFARRSLSDGLNTQEIHGLELLATSVRASYENMEGNFSLNEENHLMKGDTDLSEDMRVIDEYVSGTDAEITIFYGKTRRLTSITDSATGERIVGTDASDEVWSIVQKGQSYEATNLIVNGQKYSAFYLPLEDSDGKIIGMVFAGEPSESIDSYISGKTRQFTLVTACLMVVLILLGGVMANTIAGSLVKTRETLLHLGRGELDIRLDQSVLKRRDEIGDMAKAAENLVEKLKEIVGSLKKASTELYETGNSLDVMASRSSTSTAEISRAVEDISKSAVSQAEKIESASAEISGMGERIGEIVDNAGSLTDASRRMSAAEEASTKTMENLSASNDRTSAAISSIGEQIRLTDESIKRISAATELITSIASQTNLLSLNASIESARAGEAGKGFAVVAMEIQKLAVQSNDAAVEIQQVIDTLLEESGKTMEEMHDAEDLMKDQQKKLDDTKAKFSEVSSGISVSIDGTEKIRTSADSCNEARATVMEVIANLSAISQGNAASSQETMSSMQELNETSRMLADKAGKLKEISQVLNEDMKFFKL